MRVGAPTCPSTQGLSVATATSPSTGASRKPENPMAVPAESRVSSRAVQAPSRRTRPASAFFHARTRFL